MDRSQITQLPGWDVSSLARGPHTQQGREAAWTGKPYSDVWCQAYEDPGGSGVFRLGENTGFSESTRLTECLRFSAHSVSEDNLGNPEAQDKPFSGRDFAARCRRLALYPR